MSDEHCAIGNVRKVTLMGRVREEDAPGVLWNFGYIAYQILLKALSVGVILFQELYGYREKLLER